MKKEVKSSTKSVDKKKENKVNNKQKKQVVVETKKVKKEKKENIFKRVARYFKGVGKEFKRIRWTNAKDLGKYSVAAVAFLLFFALYFYGIDWIALLVRSLAK